MFKDRVLVTLCDLCRNGGIYSSCSDEEQIKDTQKDEMMRGMKKHYTNTMGLLYKIALVKQKIFYVN
jgi:hypothetical protein